VRLFNQVFSCQVALLLVPLTLAGCATVKGTDGAREERGLILQRVDIPRTSNYPNRDHAGFMGGVIGLLLVDALYEDPPHFSYVVELDSGRKVTLRNTTKVLVGSCVRVWLRSSEKSREDYYPLRHNDIEEVSPCAATTLPGQPSSSH